MSVPIAFPSHLKLKGNIMLDLYKRSINVNISCGNHRYQMHPIIGKVESRGKGRKTVLVNIAEVAKDLNRDPAHIAKVSTLTHVFHRARLCHTMQLLAMPQFLGVELNTQFKWKLEVSCSYPTNVCQS